MRALHNHADNQDARGRMTVLHEESGEESRKEMARHVLAGLQQENKQLSSLYFYDDVGSVIYQQITELDEYYLTRTEQAILERDAEAIVRDHMQGRGKLNFVELGAGDSRKTNVLIREMARQGLDFDYYPVDISSKAIDLGLSRVQKSARAHNYHVSTHGLVADNVQALQWIRENKSANHTVVLFLGSSIGNYPRDMGVAFLREVQSWIRPGDKLLIGADLKKDPQILHAAYSDSKGVTRDFNLNLLRRMNETLDADFDPDQFHHMASYNPRLGAMESWLISKTRQTVSFAGLNKVIAFEPFEAIHTEYSFKYTRDEICTSAELAGFKCDSIHTDCKGYFADAVWTVAPCESTPGPALVRSHDSNPSPAECTTANLVE